MTITFHNHYAKLPILAAVTWYVTLLVLLLTWICTGRPHYASQEGEIAYISDIGASFLKPLFVVGATITAMAFVLTLVSERLLQYEKRLLPTQRRSERVLSYCAIGGASLGGLGLILLSIFDTLWFPRVHRILLLAFMLGVTLSAVFTVTEHRLLYLTYGHYKALRRSYMAKAIIAGILVILSIIFAVLLFQTNTTLLEVSAVLEWIIAMGFNLYLLTFWYDLRLAAPKHEIHRELRDRGVAASNGTNGTGTVLTQRPVVSGNQDTVMCIAPQ